MIVVVVLLLCSHSRQSCHWLCAVVRVRWCVCVCRVSCVVCRVSCVVRGRASGLMAMDDDMLA